MKTDVVAIVDGCGGGGDGGSGDSGSGCGGHNDGGNVVVTQGPKLVAIVTMARW